MRIGQIQDYENALNGVQVENSGTVKKIAAAVDVSTRALQEAAKCGANLLIVHHGMFWLGLRPVTTALRRQLKFAFENDIAIYSVHLPLDLHPEVGNNVLVMRAIGFEDSEPFFEEKGSLLGRRASVDITLNELVKRLEKTVAGPVKTIAFGPKTVRRLGVITVRPAARLSGSLGKELIRSLPAKRRTGPRLPPRKWVSTFCSPVITRLKLSASKRWRRISQGNSSLIGNSSICQRDFKIIVFARNLLFTHRVALVINRSMFLRLSGTHDCPGCSSPLSQVIAVKEQTRGWGSAWIVPHSTEEKVARERSDRLDKAMNAQDWGTVAKILEELERTSPKSWELQSIEAMSLRFAVVIRKLPPIMIARWHYSRNQIEPNVQNCTSTAPPPRR